MHMADALLSVGVGATMWAVSGGATAYSIKKMNYNQVSEKKLPVMAVSGAFVFAAQMINFTIPGTGSSGHIGGGMLLAGLLGEYPAFLSIAAVLIIQCLFFADGGLLALGANIFNMGVIPCLIVYPLLCRAILQSGGGINRRKISVSSFLGAVIGLQLGAFAVVLETVFSGITELPFSTFLALMQPIHLAIGIGEGIVTALVIQFVWQMRPELVESAVYNKEMDHTLSVRKTVIVLACLAVLVAGGLSLYASSNPDGLEWSIEKITGTTELESSGQVHDDMSSIQEKTAILPDYDFADGLGTGTSVSGIIGALATAILAVLTGVVIAFAKKRNKLHV